jgi:hypothetical protein
MSSGYWPQEVFRKYQIALLVSESTILFTVLTSKINHSFGEPLKFWPSYTLTWDSHLFQCQLMQLIAGVATYAFSIEGISVPSTDPEWKCNAFWKVSSMMYLVNCCFMYFFLLEKAKVVKVGSSDKFNTFHKIVRMITYGLPVSIGLVGYMNTGVFMKDNSADAIVCIVTALPTTCLIVAFMDTSLNVAYFLLFYIPLRAVIASRINSGSPDNRHTLEIAAQRNFETTFISVAGNVIAMTMVTIGNMSSSTVTVVIMSMSAGFSVKLNTLALLYVTKNAWNFPRICVNAPASNVAVTPGKGELAKVRSDTISTPRSQVGEVGKATSDTPSTPTSQV